MNHPELFPTVADLPTLQDALDSFELAPDEVMQLQAAGPKLSESPDPLSELADVIRSIVPPEALEEDKDTSPFRYFMERIDNATSEQLRALVVFSLQKSWITEGAELPEGGLVIAD